MLCWRYLSELSGSLLPRTRWIAQRGSPAPLMYLEEPSLGKGLRAVGAQSTYHLCPFITISPPSWRMVVRMFVASDEATAQE